MLLIPTHARVRTAFACASMTLWLSGCGTAAVTEPTDAATADDAADAAADTGAIDAGADAAPVQTGLPFCPTPGHVTVRPLAAGEGLTGPAALGSEGDWVIANRKAAFVIQKPGRYHTYYYYGGLVIDAVPLQTDAQSCTQAAPETFGEMAFVVGQLNAADFPQSVLRGFRGDSAEVLADGQDGQPAILRVWGSDHLFWLVEMELIRRVNEAGQIKPRSLPMGVRLAIDYVLPADTAVLEMRLRVFNDTDQPISLIGGTVVFPDDSTELAVWSAGNLPVSGFNLQTAVPFVSARGVTSWALGTQAENLVRASISGVDALLDLGQIGTPLVVEPKGKPGDATQQTWWLSVAQGDNDRAVAALQPSLPEGQRAAVTAVSGTVKEAQSGVAVEDADVVLERQSGATWKEVAATGVVAGAFTIQIPEATQAQRLVLRKEGWPSPEPVALPATGAIAFLLPPAAVVAYEVRDDKGTLIPAKLLFFAGESLARKLHSATGAGEVRLPPGDYTVAVSRGYEYAVYEAPLTVTAQTSSTLPVTLAHLLDTTGFLSMDGHVHSAPSADSTVPTATRFVTAAAEGLEVVMNTDHEIVADPAPHLAASGVAAWVMGVTSEELTASSPEHLNLWGVPPDPSHPRGSPVPWFDQDLAQLYAAAKKRGAQLISLNHPRQANSCNYLCAVDWDRIAAAPKLTQPEAVGLPAGATLWSWDFDAVELMNGTGNIFALGVDARRNGVWDDWMSFLNAGHRITGVGVTDVHDYGGVGSPRTYFAAPTDKPAEFTLAMATSAIQAGRALVSAGAFARVSIAGKGLGETVTSADGKVQVDVEVQAIPQIDVTRIVVWANCDEVASVVATAPGAVVKWKGTIPLTLSQDAHVVVGAFGKAPMPRSFDSADPARTPRFLTNPIYVDVDGDGKWTPPGGKACAYTVGP